MKVSATITMSTPLLDRLREVARGQKRTVSQQLELVVERHFQQATRRQAKRTSRKKEAPES